MKTRRGIATNVHEFHGQLFGQPALFKMTSVITNNLFYHIIIYIKYSLYIF